jgi:RNA polymerase sigma factor (sigma-70 family)
MGKMQVKSDAQLLRDYAEKADEAAFREIVTRYTDLVYSAALRQVESPDLAADMAQGVFVDLAHKAKSVGERLAPDASLAGWLFRGTRYLALNHLRDTRRRATHERTAMENLITNSATAPDWEQIRPVLDEALAALNDDDREALLLRYFKNQDLRTVGAALGISDDAAQKRVSRAVERLRELFARRGLTVGAGGLAAVLAVNAVQAAPAGLAATISTAALGGTAVTAALTTATKAIAMTTLQKSLILATLTVVAGAGIYEARQNVGLLDENLTYQVQQTALTGQMEQLQQEHDNDAKRLAGMTDDLAAARKNAAEMAKLRGEIERLRDINGQLSSLTNDSRQGLVKSWLAREDRLRQLVAQNQGKTIPELQLLSENQWLDAAMNANFDTDKDVNEALGELRRTAENEFCNLATAAVKDYMKDNNGQFPSSLDALQPYFKTPVSDAMLDRWEIAPQAELPGQNMGGDTVITEKGPVDASTDLRWVIGPDGFRNLNYQVSDLLEADSTLYPVLKAYAVANNGQMPTTPAQIQPYLSTPEQQTAFQSFSQKYAVNPRNESPW